MKIFNLTELMEEYSKITSPTITVYEWKRHSNFFHNNSLKGLQMKRIYRKNGEILIITTKNFYIRSAYSKIENTYRAYIEILPFNEILAFGTGDSIEIAVINAIDALRDIKKALNDVLH